MTDSRNIGVRHVSDARESPSRTSTVSQNKMKTKRRMIGLQQSQSPSCHTSYNCRKGNTFVRHSLPKRVSIDRKADDDVSFHKTVLKYSRGVSVLNDYHIRVV